MKVLSRTRLGTSYFWTDNLSLTSQCFQALPRASYLQLRSFSFAGDANSSPGKGWPRREAQLQSLRPRLAWLRSQPASGQRAGPAKQRTSRQRAVQAADENQHWQAWWATGACQVSVYIGNPSYYFVKFNLTVFNVTFGFWAKYLYSSVKRWRSALSTGRRASLANYVIDRVEVGGESVSRPPSKADLFRKMATAACSLSTARYWNVCGF